VTIPEEELRRKVTEIISENIGKFIAEYVNEHEIKLKELSLIERIVRVEEELKHLKILEQERHESLIREMNARFEAINARFEAVQKDMNSRFEAIQNEMSTRFEAMNARFESLEKRLNFTQWLITAGIALISLLHLLK
ncbi:MAG: hypothetical protein QXQ66_09000, partial [Candidatus Hadarchaeum sp.]|uniref:hypothetical protein n=1 Tax=Candidatus Hadarchaeum sp. TaxID=2883567 RepID=UPI003173C6C2